MGYLRNKWNNLRGKLKESWLYRREDLIDDDISFSELYFPPSKKESGVMFKTPIILGVVKFNNLPPMLIVIILFVF